MLEYFKMTYFDLLNHPKAISFFCYFNPSKETSCLDSAKLFQHNFGCHQVALAKATHLEQFRSKESTVSGATEISVCWTQDSWTSLKSPCKRHLTENIIPDIQMQIGLKKKRPIYISISSNEAVQPEDTPTFSCKVEAGSPNPPGILGASFPCLCHEAPRAQP